MPKSILKQITGSNTPTHPTLSREERNRETALYHANLIQQRKEIQNLILESTETLLDFPSSPTSDPTHPIERDVFEVKRLLRCYQPSDYDALIQERNIDKKCGFILCPRPNRLQGTDAKYRILNGKSKGSLSLRVVERKELERWCSDECGKRALYIRVQLSDEPAWTRTTSSGNVLMLLGEKDRIHKSLASDRPLIESSEVRLEEERVIDAMRKLAIDRSGVRLEEERAINAMRELAIERGDGDVSERRFKLVGGDIRENECSGGASPLPPDRGLNAFSGQSKYIEGYESKFAGGKVSQEGVKVSEDETEDMMRTI